jgi:asparagine synthetase B (glutamine-hydrolysing)
MPGIFGAAAVEARRSPARITAAMSDLLTHQPWYGSLLDTRGAVSLGAVSTSPWFSRTARLAQRPEARLLVDGTAFTIDGTPLPDDSPDLAARLLDLYLEAGDRFPRRLGGHFNLVLQDFRTETVQLLNDRLGFAHLYWYADEQLFLFGPELKAFLAWRGFDRTLDQGAFGSLLAAQCPFGTHTLFSRVSMLAPGSHLTWHRGRVELDRYWRPEPEPREGRSDEELVDQALALYRRSVDKRIPASWRGRVVIPLSGGLDSRLLLWLARGHGDRLDLFTHGQHDCTDAVIARQTAEALGLLPRHRLVTIDPDWAGRHARQAVWLNDGQLNLRNATLIGIDNEVGPEAVPFLNGIIGAYMSLGAGGFVTEDDLRPVTDQALLRQKALAVSGMRHSRQRLRQIIIEDRADQMAEEADEQAWEAFNDFRHVELFGDQKILHINSNPGRRMQGTVDVNKYFFHDLLPFVDEELLAFWLGIPLKDRLDNRLYRELYRRRLPRLARVPWSHTGLDLFADEHAARAAASAKSKRLRRRRLLSKYSWGRISLPSKELYLHREVWLRRNRVFRGMMRDTLRAVNATGCPWFDQKQVHRLFRKFDRGGDHHLPQLLQVATVVIWHDLYLVNGPAGHELVGLEPAGRQAD